MQGNAGAEGMAPARRVALCQYPESVPVAGHSEHMAGGGIACLETSTPSERLQKLDLASKAFFLQKCQPEVALKRHDGLVNSRIAGTQSGDLASSMSIPGQEVEDDSEYDSISTSSFEFNSGDRVVHRPVLGPFIKPPPSKWDDAEKWLVSVSTSEDTSRGEWMKKMDTIKCPTRDGGAHNFTFRTVLAPLSKMKLNSSCDCYPIGDGVAVSHMTGEPNGDETFLDPILRTEKPTSDFLVSDKVSTHSFNMYDLPSTLYETSYLMPPSTVRSVAMRDMGTEMTPATSQEPSRTGTPIQATPALCSPVSSRSSTPRRVTPVPSPMQDCESILGNEDNTKAPGLTEKELQEKTRLEILALGTRLGKTNVTAWASKEEEDEDASKSLKNKDLEEVKKKILETRANAWEDAEHAKYMARYSTEEAKIQAWEKHERAKAEDEMRRIEVNVEKMRSYAHEKLKNKQAATRRLAEERRAAAQAKHGVLVAKASQRAYCIRRRGRLPSFFSCSFCH